MYVSPISAYRSNPQNLQGLDKKRKAAQPAFEGNFLRGAATTVAAIFTSLGMHAQAPASINPKILQFNPKDLKVLYLAPGTKAVTQEGLTADSLKLVKRIELFNTLQATPNGWDGKGITPEKVYSMINDGYESFLIDKVRYAVSKGEIPKPPTPPPNEVAQMKLGEIDKIVSIQELEKAGF